jgi:small-conductance mechanosensitive channel
MTRLRAGAALLGLLWVLAPLRAQAQAAPAAGPEAAAPAAVAAPADSVPVGEITSRAQLLMEEMRALEASPPGASEYPKLEAEVARYAERIEPRLPAVTEELLEAPALATLSELSLEWRSLERQLTSREDRLRKLIAALEQQIEQLNTSRELWRRTLERAREREVPPAILGAVDGVLAAVEHGLAETEGTLNDSLVLQGQFAELHGAVQQTLDSIERAQERVLANLLVRDEPPLWRQALASNLDELRDWHVGAFVAELRAEGGRYLAQRQDGFAVHLLVFGALVWLVRRARTALRGLEAEAQGGAQGPASAALLATAHPWAAAAVFALLAGPLFHEDVPRTLVTLNRLVLVVPALIVLRPLLGEVFRAPLYLLSGFFVIDRLREVLTGAPAPNRVVFAAEMVALCAVLVLLLRPGRLEKLPASAAGNRWLAALGLWVRLAAVGAGVAALASVTGYTRFASLIGGGVLGSGYAALVFYALVRIAEGLAAALFGGQALAPVRMVDQHRALFLRRTRQLLRLSGLLTWCVTVASLFAVREPLARGLRGLLGLHLGYGSIDVTLGGILAFALTLLAAWLFSRAVHFVLDEEVFPRVTLARGVPFALTTLVRYAILLIGFLLALSALGFDLDRITILLGAFGVGIGFGLQTVVNNFVSGLILLFERPVKVGDMVEVGGLEGTMQRIGIRASTVRTFDGADVIVPNAALISERVVNWTLSDRMRRMILKVGVAYGSDPARVLALLREVAEKQPGVCSYPKPLALFTGFGESALDFELRAWGDNPDTFITVRSDLNLAIHAALQAAGIEVPFPQRSLHLASVDPAAASALRGGGSS